MCAGGEFQKALDVHKQEEKVKFEASMRGQFSLARAKKNHYITIKSNLQSHKIPNFPIELGERLSSCIMWENSHIHQPHMSINVRVSVRLKINRLSKNIFHKHQQETICGKHDRCARAREILRYFVTAFHRYIPSLSRSLSGAAPNFL